MRHAALLLFIAMIVAAIFGFTDIFYNDPLYAEPVSVTPYAFSGFLFWVFMLLFLVAVISGASGRRSRPESLEAQAEVDEEERTITTGFTLALFLFMVAVVSGLFGFGVIASTLAGLAVIVFWIAIITAVIALFIGIFERRPPPSR